MPQSSHAPDHPEITRLRYTISASDDRERHYGYLHGQEQRYVKTLETLDEYHDGGPVWDLGADPYHVSWLAADQGYEVFAVDQDTDRHAAFARDKGVTVSEADIEAPEEFPADAAGTVLLTEVFEHVFDPVAALETCHRILKPGGTLILSTPNLHRVETWYRLLRGEGFDDAYRQWSKREDVGHMGHVRLYSRQQVRRFLTETAFEIQEASFTAFGGSDRGGLSGTALNAVYRTVPWLRPWLLVVADANPEQA